MAPGFGRAQSVLNAKCLFRIQIPEAPTPDIYCTHFRCRAGGSRRKAPCGRCSPYARVRACVRLRAAWHRTWYPLRHCRMCDCTESQPYLCRLPRMHLTHSTTTAHMCTPPVSQLSQTETHSDSGGGGGGGRRGRRCGRPRTIGDKDILLRAPETAGPAAPGGQDHDDNEVPHPPLARRTLGTGSPRSATSSSGHSGEHKSLTRG